MNEPLIIGIFKIN